MTIMPCEMICISINEFYSLISISELKLLKLNMRQFPNNYDVLESYLKLLAWTSFKSCLKDNIIYEKNRLPFEKACRSP